jgi:hypothetical protein
MSSTSTITRRRVRTAVLAVLTLLSLAAVTPLAATAASATTTPVVYNYASGWNSPTVRPQWVTIGQGGSPMAHTWYWNTWGTWTAKSAGTLWTNNCTPNCALGKTSYHKLYVTLDWIKWHNGTRYFYRMKWYTPGYRLHGYSTSTAVLHFGLEGGTVPGWH